MHDFNGYRGDDITPTTRSDPNSRVGTTVREMPGSEPPRSRKVNGWPDRMWARMTLAIAR
jgi:hypothetical protein